MYKNHKPTCSCCICKNKRGEFRVHPLGCGCCYCKAIRGEYKGKNNFMYNKHHTEEAIQKIIKAKTGIHPTEETRKKLREAQIGTHHSEESKRKQSEKSKQNWQNPEYKEKTLKAIFKGQGVSPNKLEMFLDKLLQQLFPNQYKYVGDGSFWVAGKNPDFINFKDKKIIELYGDYWHKAAEEQQRINHFAKHGGYQTLIVWEHELKNINKLITKLEEFHSGVIV